MANHILDAVYLNAPGLPLTPVELSVLAYLADKAGAESRASWYPQRLIASQTKVSLSTVYRAMRRLQALDLLRVSACDGRACGGRYHQGTPHYTVCPLAGEARPRMQRTPDRPARRPRGRPRKSGVMEVSSYASAEVPQTIPQTIPVPIARDRQKTKSRPQDRRAHRRTKTLYLLRKSAQLAASGR